MKHLRIVVVNPVILAGADSTLADTKPQQAKRDTLRQTITRIREDTVKTRALESAAHEAQVKADAALAQLATVTDSVPVLLVALAAQTRRADLLDSALALQRQQFGRLVAVHDAYQAEAEARIARLEDVLGDVLAAGNVGRASLVPADTPEGALEVTLSE